MGSLSWAPALLYQSSLIFTASTMLRASVLILSLVVANSLSEDTEAEELLDGAESQNYGYGYGTKVDTPHGSSTVYVHGFGSDDGYDRYQPVHHGHHLGHHTPQAFGYGHIDPYLNHKQGYGYSKAGYAGYNSVYAPHHGPHHAPHHAPHHGFHGVGHHGLGVAHHGHGAHHLPAAYGAGYGAPQPFVGSGFRYGQGYGFINGHH